MNSFAVVFLAALACANAGLIAAPSSLILQGPSSRTTIVGPDGSAISAVAPGGTVITDNNVGVLAPTVAAAPIVAAGPAVLRSSLLGPSLVSGSTLLSAGSVLAAPSVLTGLDSTVIVGPSGTITASQPLAAPALVSY